MDLAQANSVEYELFLQGLDEDVVRKISADLEEPEWMLQQRLDSLKIFQSMKMPNYGPNL
ncbi:hypothetical protein IJU97_03480 [bacterium]|nr:hypothetical protein [bacterium]